jgi:Protein of unknown function (DUF499)
VITQIVYIPKGYGRKLEEASKSKVATHGAEAIADEIAATYPFHPRLKNVIALFKENEQFKQTRGLIELVSRLLRSVWERPANDVFLIGPQHFDLGIQEVRDKLTEISGMRDVIAKSHWDGLTGAERFYLKLLDLEAKGLKTLDNYQNFAKAFKVRDFRALMTSQRANQARLKSAVEFGKTEMSERSELHQSVLRAILYAVMELVKNVDGSEVLAHLRLNVPDYYANQPQRDLVVELADYLAKKLDTLCPDEASAARVLRELVKNSRLG